MKPIASNQPPKICFVCAYCYPLFNQDNKSIFGGSEVRVSQIAKEVARRGNFRVSVIVANHGQPDKEFIDDVELINWKEWLYWGVPELTRLEAIANTIPPLPETPAHSTPNPTGTEITTSTDNAAQEIQAETTIGSSSSANKNSIYKNIIPWRARIIFEGLSSGIRDGKQHFKHSASFGQGLKAFRLTIQNYLRRRLFTARTAFSHIGDEAVYPSSVKAFEEADADIYIVPGNHWIAAWAANFCLKRKRAYVMLAGSDIDFSPDIKNKPEGQDIYSVPYRLKAYALQNAKVYIVQTERQASLARQFGIEPVIINNPINLTRVYPKNTEENLVLWVGNTDENIKRPSLMIDIIQSLPDYHFMMILTSVTPDGFELWQNKTSHIPNLTSLTAVPFSEIEQYYARAKVFVSTSSFEGFPNTFLQAGKYGVPIVSLKVDPNDMISKHGCGLLCEDNVNLLITNISKLIQNQNLNKNAGRKIIEYVGKYHDKEIIIPSYEMICTSIINN